MTRSTTLTALAVALALPAAALASVAGPAAAGASPDEGPAGHRAAPTSSATIAPTGDRAGTVLGELSPDGPRTGGLGLGARTGGTAGGDARWPSASDSLSPGPWCVYQCITSGVAYAHGDGVRLVVETSVPAEIVLLVCRDDDADFDCEYFAHNASYPGETELEWVIDPLAPGTYWVTATATDSTGTSHAFGEFTLA